MSTAAEGPLEAYYGENWESPRWFVAIAGARPIPPLPEWYFRAQVREHPRAADPVLTFTVAGGGIVFGSGTVELSDGTEIVTDWFQLKLAPADWIGRPADWSGVLEVEVSSDNTDTPLQRRTLVRRRRFIVEGDTAR